MAECGPDVIPRDSVELVPTSSSLLSSTTEEVATSRWVSHTRRRTAFTVRLLEEMLKIQDLGVKGSIPMRRVRAKRKRTALPDTGKRMIPLVCSGRMVLCSSCTLRIGMTA